MLRKKKSEIFSQGEESGYKYAITSLRQSVPLDPKDAKFAQRAADFLELPQHEYLLKWHGKNKNV